LESGGEHKDEGRRRERRKRGMKEEDNIELKGSKY